MDCPKGSTMSAAQQFYRLAVFQEIGDGTSESPGLILFLATLRWKAVKDCRFISWHCLCFVSVDWLIF